ncbi:MAG: ATP synthase F1 subunit epsilon [Candidatus Berkelbacteria bacterium]
MKTFKLKLIAPDGIKYEEDASSVSLPTRDGQITVLPGHVALITLLKPGEIIIDNGGKTHELATEGGVAEITGTEIKILADTAEDAQSLDELKIVEAKRAAEHRLAAAKDDVEFADAAAALEKQIAKLNFLTKRKKKYHK